VGRDQEYVVAAAGDGHAVDEAEGSISSRVDTLTHLLLDGNPVET